MKTFQRLTMIILSLISVTLTAQNDTLALWNFEDATKRALITDSLTFITNPYTADEGISANVNVSPITLIGARFPVATSNQWVAGSGGVGTFAPNSESWASGTNTKYWMITISTVGYNNLKLSSKQRSSSTGPRDYKVQYSTDGLVWTDVPNSTIVCAANFTSGVLSDVDLPAACNQQSALRLRWIMTSEVSVGAGTVGSAGTNRIDDIVITGTQGVSVVSATLNPNTFTFNIDQPQILSSLITWNDASAVTLVKNLNIPPDTLVLTADYIVVQDTIRILLPYLNSQYTFPGQQHLLQVFFDAGNPATIAITWDNDSTYSASVHPDTLFFDLNNPGNVSTVITWNDATSIVQITDNQPVPYTLTTSDYSLSVNTLTIQETYLSSVFSAPGGEVLLLIEFDEGNDVVLTLKSILSPPAPIVIATWNFEDVAKRNLITDNVTFISNPYTADDGIPSNVNISPILLEGGNTFSAWVTGAAGTGTYAPNATSWDDGNGTKYWQIGISTENFGELSVSSRQRSSSGGPANFAVEYSTNGTDWFLVPGSDIVCAENFTTGVLDNLPLPVACNNRPALLLRWIMTSNNAVNASPVTTTGTNRIDDIFIRGRVITNEADILEFSFPEQTGPALIDPALQMISVQVLYGTDISNLTASFVLSPNAVATVSGTPQISGVTMNDFSNIVTYLVTAGDGVTTKLWNVIVTEANPSEETEILDFSFVGYTTVYLDINSSTSTVNIDIYGWGLTTLISEFELSPGATANIGSVPQESGVTVNNFDDFPLVYTITAQDGITQRDWTVHVTAVINSIEETDVLTIRVHPNPVSDVLYVELPEAGVIRMFNLSGQMTFSAKLEAGSHQINTEHLNNGMYIIKYILKEQLVTQTFVIER